MQRLEVSGAVRPIYGSLGFKRLIIVQREATKSSLNVLLFPLVHNFNTLKTYKIV